MKTAFERWTEYANTIGISSLDSRSAQYVETRRAFYAGLIEGTFAIEDAAGETPDTDAGEKQSVEMINNFRAELAAFAESVEREVGG